MLCLYGKICKTTKELELAKLNEKTADLYYKDGSSDKEYHVYLLEQPKGWIVNFSYGRRGSTLKTGTKTNEPVEYESAFAAYSDVVSKKVKEGYTTAESGEVYQSPEMEKRFTGLVPQLLNPIDEMGLEEAITSNQDVAQEKFDGERRTIKLEDGKVIGANRDGLVVSIPVEWEKEILSLNVKSITLDGEDMGSRYAAFDMLELNGVSLRDVGCEDRHKKMEEVLLAGKEKWNEDGIFIRTPLAKTTEEKRRLHDKIKAKDGEGLVFKKKDSKYVPGRPASGGSQRKFKFIESATVLVHKLNSTKRSVFIAVMDNGSQVEVGKVTIPPNYEVPKIGAIVEVKYLYAYVGGSLFQPQYKGERSDQGLDACVVEQLKFKPEEAGKKKAVSKPNL